MSTDLVHFTGELADQMEYARAAAPSTMLPEAYRGKPANILIAIGLGSAMGLTPAESLYRIDVIQGKPCAAAELIATNVRKSGHKLRIKVTEQPPSATCTITRADDPETEVEVTRDMAWAQRMGLASKDNYKKQPATMLSWRAITACAKLACPEALYGVNSIEEMRDVEPTPAAEPVKSGADRIKGILTPVEPEPVDIGDAPEVTDDALFEEAAS